MSIREAKFVNEDAAADFLDVEVGTLRNWRWRGQGPAFHKFEGCVRYAIAELQRYADSCRRTSTTDAPVEPEDTAVARRRRRPWAPRRERRPNPPEPEDPAVA